MKKYCTSCLSEKELNDFTKKSTGRGGFAAICKDCKRKYDIEYREKNKQKLIEKRLNNKDKIKDWQEDWKKRNPDYHFQYHQKNHSKILEKSRIYNTLNKEKKKEYRDSRKKELSEYKKKHRQENKELYAERSKEYRERNKERITTVKYKRKKERLKTDIEFRIKENLRNRVKSAVKYNSGEKAYTTIDLIGCKIKDYKKHLESQFKEGMSWDNYGEWEIDHIIPCASFDLTIPENQKKCFNYKNVQPLWKKENQIKGSKIL